MITKRQIISAIRKKHNLKEEDVGLDKADGFWYWYGDITENMYARCTYLTRLDDITLERWVEWFEKDVLSSVES